MNVAELEAKFEVIDKLSESGSVTSDVGPSGNLRISVVPSAVSIEGVDFETEEVEEITVNVDSVDIPDSYINQKVKDAFGEQGELPGVVVRQIGATGNYEVMEDYSYTTNDKVTISALKGFVYDRASIPRIFWTIISKDDLSNVPPLFHDLLYENCGVLPKSQVNPYREFCRVDADNLFRELMQKSGVKSWRCELAYQAVRNFAGFAWKTQLPTRCHEQRCIQREDEPFLGG
jgi:hypothetical protein